MTKVRPIDLLVISDVHLGTYGCNARELLLYLKSIDPKIIILNGDIIDIWQFKKRYWPKSHMKVIRYKTIIRYTRRCITIKGCNPMNKGRTEVEEQKGIVNKRPLETIESFFEVKKKQGTRC